jgi:hypothetical protein
MQLAQQCIMAANEAVEAVTSRQCMLGSSLWLQHL